MSRRFSPSELKSALLRDIAASSDEVKIEFCEWLSDLTERAVDSCEWSEMLGIAEREDSITWRDLVAFMVSRGLRVNESYWF
ncbi:MAG: hypothetical protein QXU97_00150 [Fervidicoccaceae archaeon]